jgi:hypothetical protein
MSNSARKQNKYEELEQIKADLTNQVGKLRNQLREAEGRLVAVTLAIEVWKSKGSAAASEIEINPYLRSLKGLTQVQALIKIAKDNGNNRFKLKEAKKLLLDAGLVKSKKNASTILFTAIQRSEKFMRVAPGEYELLPSQSFPAAKLTVKQIA